MRGGCGSDGPIRHPDVCLTINRRGGVRNFLVMDGMIVN